MNNLEKLLIYCYPYGSSQYIKNEYACVHETFTNDTVQFFTIDKEHETILIFTADREYTLAFSKLDELVIYKTEKVDWMK